MSISDDFSLERMSRCRLSFLLHPEASANIPRFDLCKTELFLVSKGKPGIGSSVSMADKVPVEQCPVLEENVGKQASVDVNLIPRLEFQPDPLPCERLFREL